MSLSFSLEKVMADSIEKKNDKPKPNEMAKAWVSKTSRLRFFFPSWGKEKGSFVHLYFRETCLNSFKLAETCQN